jgi:hypothetical protein
MIDKLSTTDSFSKTVQQCATVLQRTGHSSERS